MAVGDADRISMSSCSSFAGIAPKTLGEWEMMGRYQCLVQLFSETLFFFMELQEEEICKEALQHQMIPWNADIAMS